MNSVIFSLTFRQLVSRRRSLLLIVFAALPILLAVTFRLADQSSGRGWLAETLYTDLIITTLLPLAALVLGTAALGAEIDDGTAFYLLAKPLSRASIILPKLAVVALIVCTLAAVTTLLAGLIVLEGPDDDRLVVAFTVAVAVGGAIYSALFILLSVITSRALIVGLAYVLIWEGLISGLFSGTRIYSVRQYTLGVADAITSAPTFVFEAELNALTTVVAATIAGLLATWLAIRRLERYEAGEST